LHEKKLAMANNCLVRNSHKLKGEQPVEKYSMRGLFGKKEILWGGTRGEREGGGPSAKINCCPRSVSGRGGKERIQVKSIFKCLCEKSPSRNILKGPGKE